MIENFTVKDPHFSDIHTTDCHLIIEWYGDAFLVLVYDTLSKTIIAVEYKYSKTFQSEILDLKSTYKSISLSLPATNPLLIPNAFFKKEKLTDIQSVTNSNFKPETHRIFTQKIDLLNTFFSFSESTETLDLLTKKLPFQNLKITHSAQAFLVSAYQFLHQQSEEKKISFVSIKGNRAYVAVIGLEKLYYFQFFDFRHFDDLLYFLVAVYDKLGLDYQNHPLLFNGTLDTASRQEFELKLKSFFTKVDSFVFIPNHISLSPTLKTVNKSLITDLINAILLCES